MRVLVVGAYGLIGSYIVARLRADGHDVIGVGRDIGRASRRCSDMTWIRADLGTASVDDWVAALDGASAVVNCAGALQDSPRDNLQSVHVHGVARLAQACLQTGVARFVHISAAGVEAGRATPFATTKLRAETLLKASALDWIILRPGLVLAPAAYGGTGLLRGLAAFPLVVPTVHAESLIQVVMVEDVALAVSRALANDASVRLSLDLVHPMPIALDDLVATLRAWLGLPPGRKLRVPPWAAIIVARVSDAFAYLGWRVPTRSATLEQLRLGIRGEAGLAERALDFKPRSLHDFLMTSPAGVQEQWFAKSYFLKPLILGVLSLFWLVSGLIGVTIGLSSAISVLTLVGIAPHLAKSAVILGSLTDIALGFAVAFRRPAPTALKGMLLVSAGYLLGGTMVRPDLWADPLGPFLKTIPAALLALAALALMDER